MRSTIRGAVLTASMLVLTSGVAAAQNAASASGRIAYVNPQALFENAPGRTEAEATFRRETETFRAELNRMSDAYNKLVADYQKEESKLAAADKERRQRTIEAKGDTLRLRQQQLEQQAGQRQNELMAPIMEAVRKVLEDIRVEDGYSMILSSEPGSSPILAADKNLDITERVVARLKTVAATKPAPAQQRPTGAPANSPSGVTRPKPPGE